MGHGEEKFTARAPGWLWTPRVGSEAGKCRGARGLSGSAATLSSAVPPSPEVSLVLYWPGFVCWPCPPGPWSRSGQHEATISLSKSRFLRRPAWAEGCGFGAVTRGHPGLSELGPCLTAGSTDALPPPENRAARGPSHQDASKCLSTVSEAGGGQAFTRFVPRGHCHPWFPGAVYHGRGDRPASRAPEGLPCSLTGTHERGQWAHTRASCSRRVWWGQDTPHVRPSDPVSECAVAGSSSHGRAVIVTLRSPAFQSAGCDGFI